MNNSTNLKYEIDSSIFSKLPGSPIVYWITSSFVDCYENPSLETLAKPCKGIDTGKNDVFLRLWFEVKYHDFRIPSVLPMKNDEAFAYKWFPYNKGGEYRKWYGNNEYVIYYASDGAKLKGYNGSNLRNKEYYFQSGVTWSTVSCNNCSFRYFDYGFLFDNGGSCLFSRNQLKYILGFLNSNVAKAILKMQPTLNTQPGTIASMPLAISEKDIETIKCLVEDSIDLARADWDSSEVSWDFTKHPMI